MYPEMKWVAIVTDELLSDDQMKVLPNGEISGVRIGYVDIDENLLAQFWHDSSYVTEELLNNQTIKIYLETSDSIAAFLRNYTNIAEKLDKIFVISLESTNIDGVVIPERLLDLN